MPVSRTVTLFVLACSTARIGLLVAALFLVPASARADDFDTLRARFVENLTGGPSLTVDPLIQEERVAIVQRAMDLLNPNHGGGLNDDGSFRGLRYDDPANPSVRPRDLHSHFGRTLALVRAYQVPGLALYRSASLAAAIERALRFGMGANRYCGSAACVTGNWWEWRIGVPGNVTYILLLMEGVLPKALLDQLATHAEYHLRPVSLLDTPANTGQNLMWFSQIHLRMAIYRRDASRAEPIKAAVAKTCDIVDAPQGDGIRPDRSFQQHHGVLYMAGYGALYAADIASYIRYTADTSFALDPGRVKNVVDFVLDGIAFTTHRGVFDPSVRGRDVNGKSAGLAPVDPFVQLAVSSPARRSELEAVAKAMMADDLAPSRMLASFMRQLDASSTPAAWPSGHRHYQDGDLTVHRRGDYYLSIKMFSTRTKSGEFANDAGRVNARQSDGRMVLLRTGREFSGPANEGLWPALDWTRMPGTTVEQTGHAASDQYGLSTEAFAGGTHDGMNGVSAMQLAALDSTLRAKKSWFFFEDYVVFLNADMTSDSDFPVETIVTQWPLGSAAATVARHDGTMHALPTAEVVEGARWFTSEGLGYWFPEPTDVRVKLETQEGNWNGLGINAGVVEAPFLSLIVDHGAHVSGAHMAYAIALRGQDMASFDGAPPFAIVQNDANVSAVESEDAAGAVFWQPGSVGLFDGVITLASDTPAVVWLSRSDTQVTVSVADPAQSTGTQNLTLSGPFVGAEALDGGVVIVPIPSGLSLVVDRVGGITRRARLTLPAPPFVDAGAAEVDGGQSAVDVDASSHEPRPDASVDWQRGEQIRGGCSLAASRTSWTGPLSWLAATIAVRRSLRRRRT